MTTLDQELSNQAPKGPTALTIGTFDGVHLGHQDLLSRLKALASDRGLHTAVLTFRRHPRLALTPGIELRYITTLEERLGLLRDSGIDLVAVVDFTRDVALLKAGEFLEMLCRRLNTKGLVVGPDFALGNNREGDIPTLRRLGGEMGFWVEPVEPVVMDKTVIRSSVIRSLLVQGEVEGAGAMLGRTYGVTGPVVEGDRRGRTLGFPTANLSLDGDLVLPMDGIYATWAVVDGRRYGSATNVGVRPTFGGSTRVVETYLLDFDGDLYGKQLTLKFVRRLRDELDFPDVGSLVEQMEQDVDDARSVLDGLEDPIGAPASGDIQGRGRAGGG
ncbi:MAG: bifunctional riboflavin kinase/FAD synthetase [Dehalococcoidia bacterium]|nr:bifunctional riboflavin kinase/FAD synthetase [Dehalococcoidia bacterium]